MSFKRGKRKVNRYDLHRVWKKLPHTLKTFDLYYVAPGGMPTGLREYHRDLSAWLLREFGSDPHAPTVGQVMAVGGLTADGWYREMLRRDGSRRLEVVHD